VQARLRASGVVEPELSRRIKEAWCTRDDPPKWPCLFVRTHDGVLVSYYARESSVVCKALKSYDHAKVVMHELVRAARLVGLRIWFENVGVRGMMAVLDLWGGATERGAPLRIDVDYFKRRRYGTHYDPLVVHSVTVSVVGMCSWHLWRTGNFVITGPRSMWAARDAMVAHLPDILRACGLLPLTDPAPAAP